MGQWEFNMLLMSAIAIAVSEIDDACYSCGVCILHFAHIFHKFTNNRSPLYFCPKALLSIDICGITTIAGCDLEPLVS